MLVYFISENGAFDIVSSAYNLRIQALEESDLLGLWHSQFLKIALSVSQTVFIGSLVGYASFKTSPISMHLEYGQVISMKRSCSTARSLVIK